LHIAGAGRARSKPRWFLGGGGARNRVAAFRQAGVLTEGAPFYLVFSPVSLLDSDHTEMLTETIACAASDSQCSVRLVVIDTLARAMAGGNENSSEDMGLAVKSIDAVKNASGAHVGIVHHSGKNEAMGARGHSSLRAAVDTEVELFRPENENVTTVCVKK
jgi:hypothetical protein